MDNFISRAGRIDRSMQVRKDRSILGKLERLRTELIDQAYLLERRGRPDAADLARLISARVGELCDEPDLDGLIG